jgi:alkanesulfonate monooxygenase SsuD/methylene tetrahydromethanopterin reductase-like flavin-dependent oxidoreductase (luciferase family)
MDYGHELLFGTFITPAAQQPHHAGIPVGAEMPRVLRLAGRMADGWSVSIRLFLATTIERFAAEVAPVTRELVAAAGRRAMAGG